MRKLMAVQDVVYKLVVDTSGANPQFEAIKKETAGLGDIKAKVDFTNLSSLNSELSKLKTIRDNALDFSTAKAAQSEVTSLEGKIKQLNTELAHTGEHEGGLHKLKEGFGDLGGLLTGGLFAAGAVGLEKIFEAGEKRTKSLEDYKIALAQSGIAEENLGAAQKAGSVIVEDLSNKYAKSQEEVRAVLTQVTGLGGVSVEQSKKVAEIGLAFEQIGVPAKAFKSILQGAGGPESAGALDTIKTKFPGIASALEGTATAGQKVDAIFKGLGPTLAGMKEAADGPLGAMERIKNTLGETLGKIGGSLIQILDPVLKIITPIVSLVGDTLGGLVNDVVKALEPLGSLFKSIGGDAGSFIDILKPIANFSLLPVKLSIEGVAIAIKGLVAVANGIGSVLSDVGNFLGLTSDIDNKNTHAAASVRDAKSAFEEYQKTIGDTNAKIADSKGFEDQVTQLDALQKKANLTADEQKKLGDLTKQLGDKFPEATAGVNAQTGAFEVNIQKLKQLSAEQRAQTSDEYKHNLEENIWKPTKDLLPALDAQKAKLGEIRTKLDEAVKSGDKDKILELRDAYGKQSAAIGESKQQLEKNLEVLVQNGIVGKGSAEEIAKGMGISKAEAEKLVPVVKSVNDKLLEQAEDAKKTAESVQGIANAFNAEVAAANKALGETKSAYAKQLEEKKKAHAEGNADAEAKADEELKVLKKSGAEQVATVKEHNKSIAAANAVFATEAKATGKSEFEVAKAQLQAQDASRAADTVQFEAQLKEKALTEFRAGLREKAELSKSEEASIAQRKLEDAVASEKFLLEKIADVDASGKVTDTLEAGSKEKNQKALEETQTKLQALRNSIAQQQLDILKLKPELDAKGLDKLKDDFASAIQKQQVAEIRFGLRPKEDILNILDDEVDKIGQKLTLAQAKLTLLISAHADPALIGQAQVEVANLQADLLNKQSEFNDKQKSLDNEVRDARIALIDNDKAREKEALAAKLADFEDYWTKRLAATGQLSEREQQLKLLGEQKFAKDLAKLTKENNELEKGLAQAGADGITKLFDGLLAKREAMSRADIDDRRLGYDKDVAALQKSYSKGEVSSREYNTKLAKFTADRTAFEAQANASSASVIESAAKAAVKATLEEVNALAVKAAILAVVGDVATLGPFGLIEAAAVGGVVKALLSGIEGLMGFANGGVLINENTKRPEIISPFKEFSEFASQIIVGSVQATKEELQKEAQRSGGGFGGSGNLNIKGEFKATGRSITAAVTKDTLAKKSERVAPRETVAS